MPDGPLDTGSRTGAQLVRRAGMGLLVALLSVLLLGAISVRLGSGDTVPETPMIGRSAALFDLKTLDGVRVSLAGLRGSPVVVNFWASWCIPCRQEAPLLEDLATNAPAGLRVVGIIYQDSPDNAQAFLTEFGVSYPTVLDPDGRAAIDYGVLGIPETFFVDRAGIIRAHQVGALSAADLPAQVAAITGP